MKAVSELASWTRILVLMLFQKNFYLYVGSLLKDIKNMYYRYGV